MSKIWLDVTTILGWQRPAVGIVRVEAECARQALQIKRENISFCRFDRVAGYCSVDPTDVLAALERIQGKRDSSSESAIPNTATSQSRPVMTLEQRFKSKVQWLINTLPSRYRTFAFNFAIRRKDAFNAALRSYQELRHALKIFVRPPQNNIPASKPLQSSLEDAEKRPIAPFGKGDVYISLGLDWDQKNLVYLYQQKRNIGFKVLLFCYDVIPVKFPHLCVGDVASSFAQYFANVAWCADEVLCISECSKRDLQSLLSELGVPSPTLSIVRLGCQLPVITNDVIAPEVAQVIKQRYILFVSTIERRKNHETLYRAYIRLIEQGEKNLPLLVFVGMPGWGVNDLLADLQFDFRTKDIIKMLNHVADADLARLYQNALFTVYPSLYEGWGLPVAESLAAGKFCLASNNSSVPEVGGELIEYLDPWDIPSWANRLKWYFDNPKEISKVTAKIKDEYKPTMWKDTAKSILDNALGLIKG